MDPLLGIYAAVTRRTLDGKHPEGWVPEQKITVEEALRAYTTGNAYAIFAEARRGKLVPGYLADVVLLDQDLTAIPPGAIERARVRATIVGGRVVFENRRLRAASGAGSGTHDFLAFVPVTLDLGKDRLARVRVKVTGARSELELPPMPAEPSR
jgi:hypothetical protein